MSKDTAINNLEISLANRGKSQGEIDNIITDVNAKILPYKEGICGYKYVWIKQPMQTVDGITEEVHFDFKDGSSSSFNLMEKYWVKIDKRYLSTPSKMKTKKQKRNG